ncbi:MAG: ABC transporter substrate-binding protein, partial [Bacteroidales bacterium]|nr:ABC transporter substrate-binding protein [Bacteroidales bacterium]
MKRFFILFLVLILFGCGVRHHNNEDKTVFRYNEAAGISSLDPTFAKDQSNIWACNQLFNGLVQFNDEMKIIPCIAKSWEIFDNGKLYTFYLRKDIFFHDNIVFENGIGRKVNAFDFEYSFKRVVDSKLASPGSWVFNYVEKNNGNYAFTALNDSVFQIRLKQVFPPFLGILAMQYCSVVPEEAINFYGKDFRRNPVGTGPFVFKMWMEGIKLVYLKNEKYFEFDGDKRLPYLDAVAISFLIDKQSAFLEFVLGNLDFMSGIDARYKDELLTRNGKLNPKYNDKFKLITQPYLNTEYLGILVDNSIEKAKDSPLSLKLVRQAINYGFDRKKMMKYLRNNIGMPGNYGIIPKGLPAFDSSIIKGYSYNPDKARQLLTKAGFSTGEDIPSITLSTTAEYLDLCEFIQHQLNEIGFDINIDVNPPGALK